jgi:tRNA(fMet)-specific endonuclease VapC
MRLLINTNIYSHAMRGDESVASVLRKVDEIAVSVVSIGELISRFKGGDRERDNREELNAFLDSPRVRIYDIDDETAEFYADILHRLRSEGKPIPTNDIWIAATAFQNGLRLFSKDRLFMHVSGLSLMVA